MGENTNEAVPKEKAEKKEKKHHIKNLKAEFKKIIWPDKKKAGKQTFAVILSGVFLGVLIAILDTVIKFGLGFIL